MILSLNSNNIHAVENSKKNSRWEETKESSYSVQEKNGHSTKESVWKAGAANHGLGCSVSVLLNNTQHCGYCAVSFSLPCLILKVIFLCFRKINKENKLQNDSKYAFIIF